MGYFDHVLGQRAVTCAAQIAIGFVPLPLLACKRSRWRSNGLADREVATAVYRLQNAWWHGGARSASVESPAGMGSLQS